MENREKMPLNREIVELFSESALLAAVGGLIASLKHGIPVLGAILNSAVAGLFMMGVGAGLKALGASDYLIFFSSGIVGYNSNFFLNWWFRLSSSVFSYFERRFGQ